MVAPSGSARSAPDTHQKLTERSVVEMGRARPLLRSEPPPARRATAAARRSRYVNVKWRQTAGRSSFSSHARRSKVCRAPGYRVGQEPPPPRGLNDSERSSILADSETVVRCPLLPKSRVSVRAIYVSLFRSDTDEFSTSLLSSSFSACRWNIPLMPSHSAL